MGWKMELWSVVKYDHETRGKSVNAERKRICGTGESVDEEVENVGGELGHIRTGSGLKADERSENEGAINVGVVKANLAFEINTRTAIHGVGVDVRKRSRSACDVYTDCGFVCLNAHRQGWGEGVFYTLAFEKLMRQRTDEWKRERWEGGSGIVKKMARKPRNNQGERTKRRGGPSGW
ncbi:hypothetical protein BDN72DRAFT_854775 [Pluteus cervinus]|uniref:Uncharacterized protein n=1 Tax=Pluteus cervinus TaxID=181527 RepID=A0ACD3B623_9AGAR|nr:hypothetical protein BDN72DRAFT_854775 [Pluteus cervinus]